MSRPIGSTKYQVNDGFFCHPNKINSYWAGFLAADGALTPERNNVRLGISTKDENHLENFKSDIDFNGPIRYSNDLCVLEVYSKQWRESLEKNFHVTPRKTFTLTFPKGLSSMSTLAFIAGYIDGDGCIGTYKNTNGQSDKLYDMPSISVIGTRDITERICFVVNDVCGSNERSSRPFRRKNVYQYSFYGKRAKAFAEIMRKLNVPLLDRKWSQV